MVDTRGVPYSQEEYAWAHARPPRHWVRMPALGDTICYRHDPWGEVTDADVMWLQPLDDVDDPHVHSPVLENGRPLLLEGRAVMAQKPDPWRLLRIRTRYGLVETREARLRGAPGWLPRDWRARYRPLEQPVIDGSGLIVAAHDEVHRLVQAPRRLTHAELASAGSGAVLPSPAPWEV